MSTTLTITTTGAGRRLAERLGFRVLRVEGHDLVVACPSCPSSDALRIDIKTGAFHCYSCGVSGGALKLCELAGLSREEGKRLLIELGIFEARDRQGVNNHGGNGRAAGSGAGSVARASATPSTLPPPSVANHRFDPRYLDKEFILAEFCRLKRIPSVESFKAYGAYTQAIGTVWEIRCPLWTEEGEHGSSTIFKPTSAEDLKGKCEKGGHQGLYLPGRIPQAGEHWIITEGVKDSCALHHLGFLACGLSGSAMNAKFAPLFRGVFVTVFPDSDVPGFEGALITAKVLEGIAA
jgi:hypothetical protein